MTLARLYGFDARTPLAAIDPAWTPERRSQYLLRPTIARPLSVDRRVWPPVLPERVTDGFAPDYWASAEALLLACAQRGLAREAFTLVALEVLGERDEASALVLACTPSTIDPTARALGWDVADNGLTSGLSNCGYRDDEVEGLRRRFAASLADNGLFTELAAAEAFRALADARVPEHAPFLVHRLYALA